MNHPRIRISFFIQHYPPYLGGAETQARELAEAMAGRGHEVQVFTTRFRSDLPRVSAGEGFRIRRLPTIELRALRLPLNLLSGLWASLFLARGSDIFHGHCLSPFTLGALIGAKWRRAPILFKICATGCGGDVAKILDTGLGKTLWRLFRGGGAFIAPTRPVAAELVTQGARLEQVAVIPNLLSLDNPAVIVGKPVRRRELGLPERLTVLYVGRLSPGKGLDALLPAWPEVTARADAQLVLVGDGPDLPQIQRRIAALGLDDKVILTGYQSDPAPYYQAADIFVFPSGSETFGNAIVEAMGHGLPVLTTSVGVVKEWESDAPLRRLDDDSARPLSDQLVDLLDDPATRSDLGHRARQFITDRYPVDGICAQYEKLYDNLRHPAAPRA